MSVLQIKMEICDYMPAKQLNSELSEQKEQILKDLVTGKKLTWLNAKRNILCMDHRILGKGIWRKKIEMQRKTKGILLLFGCK